MSPCESAFCQVWEGIGGGAGMQEWLCECSLCSLRLIEEGYGLRRTTPDMVFYQCFMHKKLGWIIQVRALGYPALRTIDDS